MPRPPGHLTTAGALWFAEVAGAQQRVTNAEHERDVLVRRALEHGLGVRGAARALKIDKATVSRRYGQTGAKREEN
ncbi:MAG: hypothetical protein ACRDLK_09035 [Gaiellaceae bacterium]